MPKYRITAAIERVSGHQWFTVDAATKRDAIEAFERGEATFEDEEVEITSLVDIDERDVEVIDD